MLHIYLHRLQKFLTNMLLFIFIFGLSSQSIAAEYNFIVQPILDPEKTKKLYKPLADYLSQHTGHKIKIITERNFLTYWYKMKKGKYDLVLDAAHFTDFRIDHLDYSVLAKIPDTVSYSLITHSKNLILNPSELIGKTLVSLPAPSIGTANLQKIFPSPTRQPVIITMKSAAEAVKSVQSGKYFAALVPTPLINNKSDINIIKTTDPVPHMAVSASNKIDKELQIRIKNALVNAKNIHSGQKLLHNLGISAFNTTTAHTYKGYKQYLAGMIRSSRLGTSR